MRVQGAAAEVATSARGKMSGNDSDNASDNDAAQVRLELFSLAIAKGFSFGPSNFCGCCHATLIDFDSKSAGFCERCWAAIEAPRVASESGHPRAVSR
jgi:hypothetical protein